MATYRASGKVVVIGLLDFDMGFFDRHESRIEPCHNPFA
jgi:hypothetical protein